jgi:hypothetical protein
VIQPDEVDERRRQFIEERMGIDLSRPVRVEEVANSIRERMGQRTDGRSADSRAQQAQQAKEEVSKDAYRVTGTERLKNRRSYRSEAVALPEDLPSWWTDKDANGDGQVTLSEYLGRDLSNSYDAFSDLDSNRDGIVTAHEAHVNAQTE